MGIQLYRGLYCGETLTNTKLDLNSILVGCDVVDEEGASFLNALKESMNRIKS